MRKNICKLTSKIKGGFLGTNTTHYLEAIQSCLSFDIHGNDHFRGNIRE